ncbi:MAG: RNA pseudouridine synthase [Gammaproteobacteria bacterium]|nr:RNA pseudouridine synthase [Gammaproteobacteria bacterium]
MRLTVLHQNAELLVLDKPSGVSVLADRSGAPCLLDAIRGEHPAARLVHRIDKGTSGVLVLATSRAAQRRISQAFTRREVGKHYVAQVTGHVPRGTTLTIELPLKPGRKSRYRVAGLREEIRASRGGWSIADAGEGAASVTRIRVLTHSRDGPARSLLAVQPLTGRTHQIRVHLAWVGHAVVGDRLYGAPDSAEQSATRLMLHAHRLVLPGYGTFVAALPW